MLSALVITLREGLEAALIIGILLAYLTRVGRSDRAGTVWLGTGLAVLASVGVGATIFLAVGTLEDQAEQIFEGVALFLAVGVLSYMIRWMHRQAHDFRGNLQRQASIALGNARFGLAALAFLVVVREGLETVLFLFGATRTSSVGATLLGGLVGLGLAAMLGYGLYRSGLHLDLRMFFTATGLLLVFFAAGMLAYGIHEFIEAGVIPAIVDPVWDVNPILSDKSTLGLFLKALFGYNGNPALTEVVAYVVYLGAMLRSYLRPAASERLALGRSP